MVSAVSALPLSPIAAAVKSLYGVATDINRFIDDHIDGMKQHPSPTVARSGRVLEAAKAGFGIGYLSSVTIIAAGQLLLGNQLAALGTVATAATLANPFAMTCAALGAVIYGYGALTDREREELLQRLSHGLEIGVELIRSIVRFAIDMTRKLLSAENIHEMKQFIRESAEIFGRTLSDVTRKMTDRISDWGRLLTGKSRRARNRTIQIVRPALQKSSQGAGRAVARLRDRLSRKPTSVLAGKAERQPPAKIE